MAKRRNSGTPPPTSPADGTSLGTAGTGGPGEQRASTEPAPDAAAAAGAPGSRSAVEGLLTVDQLAAEEEAAETALAEPDSQPATPPAVEAASGDGLRLVMIECPLAVVEGYAARTIEDLPRRTAATLKSLAAGLEAAGMKLETGRRVRGVRDALIYLAEQLEAGANGGD